MKMDADAYKVAIYIPEDHSERMMAAINQPFCLFVIAELIEYQSIS